MEQLNRIEIRGVVGAVRSQIINGNKMSKFSVATSRAYKDREGVAQIDTTWHNVIAWESDKITDLDKIQAGSKVYALGRLQTQKYMGADGVEKTYYEVVASKVNLIESDEPLQYAM
ncbi:MAG: single-stranded DNA-binding protein [Bacteroidales bacterium]|nr:single-stranded DNA-binding protein [Bacteroidales bacterium]